MNKDLKELLILFILISAIMALLFWGIYGLSVGKSYEQNIYSLEDNLSTSGSFVLGAGSIDTDMYYFYYTKNDMNGFKLNKINSDFVIIYQDTNKPYINCKNNIDCDLHIPKNTIKIKYNLDMK